MWNANAHRLCGASVCMRNKVTAAPLNEVESLGTVHSSPFEFEVLQHSSWSMHVFVCVSCSLYQSTVQSG